MMEDWIKTSQLWPMVLVLFLLVSLTSCVIGYQIGKTGNLDRFSGQIVDTISVDFGNSDKTIGKQTQKEYRFTVRGKVQYEDGKPYKFGRIELRSTPRFTISDEYGRFEFTDVEVGKHTVSIVMDGKVIASGLFTLESTSMNTSRQLVALENGTYLVLSPVSVSMVQLVLELDENNGVFNMLIKQGTDIGVPDAPLDSGIIDGKKDPKEPLPDEKPSKPYNPETPDNPGGGLPEDEKPNSGGGGGPAPSDPVKPTTPANIAVSDDSALWQQSTSVDIFAERPGNQGVQTIDGKSVIAPGSGGVYLFKIKNTNSFPIGYSIHLSEVNQNILELPMKYRILSGISGTNYVGGADWKTAKNILVDSAGLNPDETAYYTLQWKWDNSNNALDTKIGEQKGTTLYIIDIVVSAEALV